jgi:hypothetical protein
MHAHGVRTLVVSYAIPVFYGNEGGRKKNVFKCVCVCDFFSIMTTTNVLNTEHLHLPHFLSCEKFFSKQFFISQVFLMKFLIYSLFARSFARLCHSFRLSQLFNKKIRKQLSRTFVKACINLIISAQRKNKVAVCERKMMISTFTS